MSGVVRRKEWPPVAQTGRLRPFHRTIRRARGRFTLTTENATAQTRTLSPS